MRPKALKQVVHNAERCNIDTQPAAKRKKKAKQRAGWTYCDVSAM